MYSPSETIHKYSRSLPKMAVVYTIAVVLLFTNCKVIADSLEKDACLAVFNGTIDDRQCCESLSDSDESSQCNYDGDSCDYFKCLAVENKLLVDDKINDEKVFEMLKQWEKETPSEKAAVDRVRRNCAGGKFLDLLPDSSSSDICEPMDFFVCVYINQLLECSSWKNDEQCSKMKEYTKTCQKYLEI